MLTNRFFLRWLKQFTPIIFNLEYISKKSTNLIDIKVNARTIIFARKRALY